MSIAPQLTPTPRRSPHSAPQSEAQRHIAIMGYEDGAVEIVAGTNRPGQLDKIELVLKSNAPKSTRAFIPAGDLAQIERRAARLAEQYGNVYASVGTYGKAPNPHRPGTEWFDRAAPLPRRCFILDDVKDLAALRLAPSWATETSPNNYQVGYVCTALLSPAESVRLAEGAARLEGTDPSGADAQQLIRIAGTLNTKPKCDGRPGDPDNAVEPEGWRVRLVIADGPQHSRETLARAFLPGGVSELGSVAQRGAEARERRAGGDETPRAIGDIGIVGDEAWRSAAWRDELRHAADLVLPNVRSGAGGLLADNGIPRGLKPSSTAYRILENVKRGVMTFTSPSGNWDASRERKHVLKGCALIGYNRAELAAIGLELANFGEEVKGSAEIWIDIARVVWKITVQEGIYRPRRPEPTGSTAYSAAPRLFYPRVSTKGRPAGQRAAGADALLSLLRTLPSNADGERVTKYADLAAVLDCSRAMVRLYMDDLRTAGDVETRPDRRALCVLIKSAAPDLASAEPATEAAEQACNVGANRSAGGSAECGVTTGESGAAPTMHRESHPAPSPALSPGAAPSDGIARADLLRLVEDAAGAIRSAVKQRLDKKTGELVSYRPRPTLKAVTALIQQARPELTEAQIAAGWELYRDTWGRERERLAGMADADLLGAAQTYARRIERARRVNSPRLGYWAALLSMAEGELYRRGMRADVELMRIERQRAEAEHVRKAALKAAPKQRRPKQTPEERKAARQARAERIARNGSGLVSDEEAYKREQAARQAAIVWTREHNTGAGPAVGTGLRPQVQITRADEPDGEQGADSAGCVSPNAAQPAQPEEYDASAMIARLRARQAA